MKEGVPAFPRGMTGEIELGDDGLVSLVGSWQAEAKGLDRSLALLQSVHPRCAIDPNNLDGRLRHVQ